MAGSPSLNSGGLRAATAVPSPHLLSQAVAAAQLDVILYRPMVVRRNRCATDTSGTAETKDIVVQCGLCCL